MRAEFTGGDADPAAAFTVTRSYDAAGDVGGVRASGEATRAYAYDKAGQLTSLTLGSDSAGNHTTYAYDRAGLPVSRALPDGSVTGWGYDPAGRLTSIADTMPSGVLSFAYTRDANGSVTAENSTRYGYDALNRLASWYDPSTDSTTTYSYDANYNLTSVAVGGVVTRSLSYDAADRISSPGYTFDRNGNMTSDGTRTYAYDALNRLSAVTGADGAVIAAYAYDFMNRRVSSTDSSGTTYFHYDGAGPDVIAETDGAGHTAASYAYDASGRLHSMTRGGATYYYHANAHGDVVALTDAAGDVVDSYRYDPWGKVLEASETVPNPYRYAGYRYDEPTGLYHLWNRYYSPSDFRFVTKDLYPGQTKAPGTMNGYAYCLDDPVNAVDPDGLFFVLDDAAEIVILIFVAATAVVTYMETPAAQRNMRDSLEWVGAHVQQAWNTAVPAIEKTAQDCMTLSKGGNRNVSNEWNTRARSALGSGATSKEMYDWLDEQYRVQKALGNTAEAVKIYTAQKALGEQQKQKRQ